MCKPTPCFYGILEDKNILFSTSPGGHIVIHGGLDMRNTGINRLPHNLVVTGALILSGCPITELPNGLHVHEYLDLKDTPIRTLPDDMIVGNGVFLENSSLIELTDGLSFNDSLDLENSRIKSLPNDLNIGGYLNIKGTDITTIPDSLRVGSHLLLDIDKITNNIASLTVDRDDIFIGNEVKHNRQRTGIDFLDAKITMFAVLLSGEIKISLDGFFGTEKEFKQLNIPTKLNHMVRECINKLTIYS
ncbi:hypothetical protein SJI19_00380 [Acerihabitans sp. TG2]|uniref:hypothetical protein n=1 Tax=Acerihabitans sp. TG2 TaxID=3096008 RepID=UPI002B232686|nr:hypothetical protein [Acerihabitans sp. TG2]MEA9389025.1 hypothetical protein [Acerihabitans sp. TG2]